MPRSERRAGRDAGAMAAGEDEAAWGLRPAKVTGVRPVEPTRKFMACLRKYLLAYLRVLGALGDLDTLQVRALPVTGTAGSSSSNHLMQTRQDEGPEATHMGVSMWLPLTAPGQYDSCKKVLLDMQAASVYLRTPREWNYWLCHIDCVADLARHAPLTRCNVLTAPVWTASCRGPGHPCSAPDVFSNVVRLSGVFCSS